MAARRSPTVVRRERATETKSPPQGDAAGSLHPSFKKGAQVLWHGKVAKIVNGQLPRP
jgi:hypothetical protein